MGLSALQSRIVAIDYCVCFGERHSADKYVANLIIHKAFAMRTPWFFLNLRKDYHDGT